MATIKTQQEEVEPLGLGSRIAAGGPVHLAGVIRELDLRELHAKTTQLSFQLGLVEHAPRLNPHGPVALVDHREHPAVLVLQQRQTGPIRKVGPSSLCHYALHFSRVNRKSTYIIARSNNQISLDARG